MWTVHPYTRSLIKHFIVLDFHLAVSWEDCSIDKKCCLCFKGSPKSSNAMRDILPPLPSLCRSCTVWAFPVRLFLQTPAIFSSWMHLLTWLCSSTVSKIIPSSPWGCRGDQDLLAVTLASWLPVQASPAPLSSFYTEQTTLQRGGGGIPIKAPALA